MAEFIGGATGIAVGISHVARMMTTASHMRDAVLEVVHSPHFDVQIFRDRKLTLSQAYCLLWQDAESGNVWGRQASLELTSGATAACLVDLVVMGKIGFEITPKTTVGVEGQDVYVKVMQDSPTGTYLDKAIFERILERHHKKPDNPRKLKCWILKDINICTPKKRSGSVTLDSMAELGILKKNETRFTIKYPTANPAPEEDLIKEIQQIGLEEAELDSFMRSLLTIMRAVDNLHLLWDPLLKKCFPKEKYNLAKERIKGLVEVRKDKKENNQELQPI